jgi:hypothetical protein
MKNSNNIDNSNMADMSDMSDMSNGMDINIYKLITDLENIGNEKAKEEFIKNYSKIKEQIKTVDSILFNDDNDNNNDNDNNISSCENIVNNNFESNNINDLLSILETSEEKIFDTKNLTVGELKSLIQICNILEKKINDETINIIEIK